jgi:acyl transferase domain-containing protein
MRCCNLTDDGPVMTDQSSQKPASLAPGASHNAQVLAALREARSRIETLERSRREPIAIVGMACRLPGAAAAPEAFWNLLASRGDAITPVPANRWTNADYFSADPGSPGTLNVTGGGFIDLPQDFDPEFFGMAPREALSLDPQQRLLLEVSWEALENAGIAADRLNGTEIGVFAAICWNDYGQRLLGRDAREIDAYMASGIANSMAAGRLSYVLGLHGPSITVDTACSSSLVAVHLACQSLRNGECGAAMVGGASQLLHPELYVNFTKARMLSPDNRCKTFDAGANGFVRSEGCVVIVLKRLSDALANADEVLAVIRGSAINHDGHTSGLTVPNGPAQQDVIRKALRAANLTPADIDYIETHGTGTALGDPIEVGALGAVFGAASRTAPLVLGAVKSSIGHLEAAAGLAGLLKVVLALRHEAIPANLHFRNPNPHIDWPRLPFAVPVREQPWKRSSRTRVAGVSSFGFSGTNAHVVIAEAPLPARAASEAVRPAHVLTLTARSENALKTLAGRYAQRLGDGVDLGDVAFSANTGRAQFLHRAAVCASSSSDAAAALTAMARGETSPAIVRGRVERGRRPRIAFLFTGQGSQYVGMGRALYQTQPTFKAALDRCDHILSEQHGVALLESLYRGGADLNATQITQPALFAIGYALSELWTSWGVAPTQLMGHSVGEYVAACVAGVFGLEEGLTLIAARGRLMGALPSNGAMAAVLTDESTVAAALAPHAHHVAIAAVNGPANIVISGNRDAVEQIIEQFTARGVRTVPLAVSHAFHSPLLEPMLAKFRRIAETITYSKPRLEVISNLSGGAAGAEIASADYWCRHVRAPVRFAAGMQALHARGCNTFIEIGPRPVLLGMGRQCIPEGGTWLPSLRPDANDWSVLLPSVSSLYVQGVPVDWTGFDRDYVRNRVPLPNYPFERQRYWIDAPDRSRAAFTPPPAGLLGSRVPLATGDIVYTSRLSAGSPAYLADHVIAGRNLMPATAFLEMALAAQSRDAHERNEARAIEDVVFVEPLVFHEQTPVEIQLVAAPGLHTAFRILSRKDGDETWTLHASGRLASAAVSESSPTLDVDAARSSLPRVLEGADHYERARTAGLEFGTTFQGLKRLWRDERVALGELVLPAALAATQADTDVQFHPALLDACLQVATSFASGQRAPVVPLSVSRLVVYKKPGARLYSRAVLQADVADSGAFTADVTVFDESGMRVAEIEGFACRPIAATARARESGQYDIVWRLAPATAAQRSQPHGSWLILADKLGYAEALAQALKQSGARALLASPAGAFRRFDQWHCELDFSDRAQIEQLLQAAPAGSRWSGVVHCAAIGGGGSAPNMSVEQLDASQTFGCGSLLALVQAMAATPAAANARLMVVTRGVHSVSTETLTAQGIAGATAWGLARVIASEHPETHCLRIDLDPHAAPHSQAYVLAAEVLNGESGEEIALRAGGQRYIARLCTHGTASLKNEVPAGPVRLEASHTGILDELRWVSHTRKAPGARELEIEVRATGLGFRDVLNSLGMYPGGPVPLGCECAGVVVGVGSEVRDLRVGDAVLAVAYGSFATHITVPAEWVARLPGMLSFSQAAAIPSSFLTAEYSLLHVAKLAQGQRVLIHAGAGGVGNAAIQVALRAGAEVFATAGSAGKRTYLASIGVQHVYDSRSTAFADEILRETAGQGVEVVLNSLADEFIERSFAALAAEGCFIELGKRGILTAAQAKELKPHARYVVVDLSEVAAEQPARLKQMLSHVVESLENGTYSPLPVTSFAAGHATEAFQHMARARHTGKIVITPAQAEVEPGTIRADATYVVTGGLGALGLQVARSLVARGARHLALIARRRPDDAAATQIARFRDDGIAVRVLSADVGDTAAITEALSDIRRAMPPLRGVVHAAGVIDDGAIAQQSWARCSQVLAPKVRGAWNLHQLTQHDSLDFFVLFSAASAILGIPGQGTYVAANVFLDSLAAFRRATGLPATSINWGAWDQFGMAQSPDAVRSLSARGLRFIATDEGIAAMWRVIADNATQRVVLPIDWHRFRERAGNVAMPMLSECFALQVRQAAPPSAPQAAPAAADLATRLSQAPKTARYRMLADLVIAHVRRTIGLAADRTVDERQPLQELGLDSLMAVELRNALGAMSSRTLPATLAFDYPTAEAITRHLLGLLVEEQPTPAEVRTHMTASAQVADADIAALSDDEATELLLQELDGVAGR